MKIRLFCIAIALLCTLAGGARAAEFAVQASANDAWIFIRGQIGPGDGAPFQKLLGDTANVSMVVLESNGGSLRGGQDIGNAIRARGLPTLVRDGVSCAMACADAWVGGARRYLAPTARIFFHEAFARDWRANPAWMQAEITATGTYLNRMGLSAAATAFMTGAAPSRTPSFGPADARAFGFDVITYTGTPAPPVAGEPVPETAANGQGPTRLERIARDFAATYFAQVGERPEIALDYFRNTYADTVTFNGTTLPRAKLLEQFRAQSDRWPEQVFAVRPDSITAKCIAGTALCEVSAIADWDWSSWGRGARATGATHFWFQISLDDLSPVIRAETQTELSRAGTGPQ